MLSAEGDATYPVVKTNSSLLPLRAPGGLYGLWNKTKIGDRPIGQTPSLESPAPQERQATMIEQVPIQVAYANARSARAHETVQWLLEKGIHGKEDLVGEIASKRTLSGAKVIGSPI